ncbi:cysteine desulfurase family protein [Nocardioides bruguierae]|uniref:cysteine desulfurase family protein n=1 Tax=Nocardioides bruguierae TaxID=2945102 RepID=UPI002020FAAB|nr:cysteine desulfurase family protein [Nocardioides bruguierae]MCL8026503.1 cysteine desulfurase [Nocardioides bruguierae]
MSRPSVYLDHAATTPLSPVALEAMTEELAQVGNASSLHASGRRARRVVEESRERIAAALGCLPSEVVLTSGGTEADNLALKGGQAARRSADPSRRRLLVSSVEHHAVLDPAEHLAATGEADLGLLRVDHDGRLDLEALRAELGRGGVSLLSLMWANNEVGTLQPVAEAAALCAEHGVPVHSDAVQALSTQPVDFAASGLDAVTVSAHKVGGPIGVGALVARRDLALTPLVHGGGQERDVRSGTLPTPLVAAFAAALEQAVAERETTAARLLGLSTRLVAGLRAAVPDAVLNGPALSATPDAAGRLPGIVHVSFPGCQGDSLLMLLDAAGVECSTGSACSAGVPQPSHVLLAMGRDEAEAKSSLRFSLGRGTTEADVDAAVDAIGPAVERARLASGRGTLRRGAPAQGSTQGSTQDPAGRPSDRRAG